MHKCHPFIGKVLTIDAQLCVPNGDHCVVPHPVVPHLLQQAVTLFEGFRIGYKVLKVSVVGLRNDAVHELAPQVASAGDELLVVGRNHHQGNLSYVFRESLVGFLVPLHLLSLSAAQCKRRHITAIMPMDGKIILAKTDILAIDRVEIALAEREIVDSVEQVGFSGAIVAHKAVDVVAKGDIGLRIILEITHYQPIEHHNA